MDEATIGLWQVKVGDHVNKGDSLVELISDKTVAELESPTDGEILAILATPKSTLPVSYNLAVIGNKNDQIPDLARQNETILATANSQLTGIDLNISDQPTPSPTKAKNFRAAPAARILAKKHNISLEKIANTTNKKIIHRKDVEQYIQQQNQPTPQKNNQPLTQSVALITGASGGIGQAIALQMAQQSIGTIILHYHNNKQAVKQLAEKITTTTNSKIEIKQADLTKPDQAQKLIEQIIQTHTRLDILINNAGTLQDAMLSFMTNNQWQEVIDINLTAPFYLCRAVAMTMARQRSGRIINITSDAGTIGSASRANYAAAKEGLVGFTRSIARELASLGVRVNAVSPGFIQTAMTKNIKPIKQKEIIKTIPVRRFGTPQEVANIVVMLTLPISDYITGQVFHVDGGLFMG